MKKSFRYDYNNKWFIFSIIGCAFVTTIAVIAFILTERIIECSIVFLLTLGGWIYTFCVNYKYGIHYNCKTKTITIVEDYFVTKLSLMDYSYVSIDEIEKEKGTAVQSFFSACDFSKYMRNSSNYVFNEGKVYYITFHKKSYKSTRTRRVYFGFLFREKSSRRVQMVYERLLAFVEFLNDEIRLMDKNKQAK